MVNRGAPAAAGAESDFSGLVIRWQQQHGRRGLPWQDTRDPYRVWLSEIMLQQTQVASVIPYYHRFLSRFPDVGALASAPSADVMAQWSGLGYYARARNLHRCAQIIVNRYAGVFPSDPRLLDQLPGIGRSTAAAIAAFSYGVRAAILDGNVKRVLARVFGVEGDPAKKLIEDALWRRAEALLPQQGVELYTQGLMDLGATQCTRHQPSCGTCPLKPRCIAFATNRVQELPTPKPKKVLPEKHARMLVITHRDQVLLQQRPGVGVWGGLLSLPELDGHQSGTPDLSGLTDPDQQVFADAVALFGDLDSCQRLPLLLHTFTHFRLHVLPYRICLRQRRVLACQATFVWFDCGMLAQAPLPAPVKKLLLEIFSQPKMNTSND